eukprot:scaffold4085_cov113-Isochrysis_galbana.AAC.3
MEANRDDSRQALAVAMDAEERGDAAKAERFARKSQDLFPSPGARALLDRLAAAAASSATMKTEQAAPTSNSAVPGAADRPCASTAASAVHSDPGRPVVDRIMRAQHHYEMFGLEAGADVVTIRRAYRKLAIMLHPDKNSAPGAIDAFQRATAAVEILTDAFKRQVYDRDLAIRMRAGAVRSTQPGASGAAGHPAGSRQNRPSQPPAPQASHARPASARPPPKMHIPPGIPPAVMPQHRPPPAQLYKLGCPKCATALQASLQTNYGVQPMRHVIQCPLCSHQFPVEVAGVGVPNFAWQQPGPAPPPTRVPLPVAPPAQHGPRKQRQGAPSADTGGTEESAARASAAAMAAAAVRSARGRAKGGRGAGRACGRGRRGGKKRKGRAWSDDEEEDESSEHHESSEEEDGEPNQGLVKPGDPDYDECFYCEDGGNLLCCDGCPKTFHLECLVPPMREADLPDGDWYCPFCVGKGSANSADGAAPSREQAAPASDRAAGDASNGGCSCGAVSGAPVMAASGRYPLDGIGNGILREDLEEI